MRLFCCALQEYINCRQGFALQKFEESTAAAHTLEQQAQALTQVMTFFATGAAAPQPPVTAKLLLGAKSVKAGVKKPVVKAAGKPKPPAKASDNDWREF